MAAPIVALTWVDQRAFVAVTADGAVWKGMPGPDVDALTFTPIKVTFKTPAMMPLDEPVAP